jgi:GntR family transcriptional repressor for pyruvate dehydrogenase complex
MKVLKDPALIKPVSKDLLYVKVADAIQSYINTNKLQPGDKIPSERELAEMLQIGRNSVREALRVLENEGIIEVKTGKGVYVAQKSSPDSIYLKLIKVNYMELMDTKMVLEKSVIDYAAKNATAAQLEKLESFLVQMEKAAARGIYAMEQDNHFHHSLLEIRNNKMLEQIVLNLIKALDKYAGMLEEADTVWITTIPYHRQLLEAIKHGDRQAAFDAYDRIYQIDLIALNSARDNEARA